MKVAGIKSEISPRVREANAYFQGMKLISSCIPNNILRAISREERKYAGIFYGSFKFVLKMSCDKVIYFWTLVALGGLPDS